MTIHLLTTKVLIPPPRLRLVDRPRLLSILNESTQHNLTLICAPAGYGKTTLLTGWISKKVEDDPHSQGSERLYPGNLAFCWLTLDDADNDLVRFMSYLNAAFEKVWTGVGVNVRAMLDSYPLAPLQTILTVLINGLSQLPSPILLILDDYQSITNRAIHEGVSFFIDHLPPNVHLVISTRSDPPIPLARLRARSQLMEIRAADLRFSDAETAEFFTHEMETVLSLQDIARLEERTEGWIAGLQMAALALKNFPQNKQADASLFVENFSGSNRYILDYLMEEVLSHQPEQIQNFLLQTSILENLNSSLCDALIGMDLGKPDFNGGSSQETLEYLERANLFLMPLDSERLWYRYHYLFAELMRARLTRQAPELVPELHQRASLWYARNQRMDAAVEHAFLAGSAELAARWIDAQVETLLTQNGFGQLSAWIQRLPAGAAERYPWLCIAQAWTLAMSNQMGEVEPFLEAAERAIRPEDPLEMQQEWRGQIACIRSERAVTQGDTAGTIEMALLALDCLSPQDVPNLTFARYLLGRAYLEQGELDQAITTLSENVRLCIQSGIVNSLATSLTALSRAYRIQGRLHAPLDLLQEGLHWIDTADARRSTVAGTALVSLGEVLRERNDLETAEEVARRSLELSLPWKNPTATCFSYILLARVLQAQGNWIEAGEALAQAEEAIRDRTPFVEIRSSLSTARVDYWLAAGQLTRASEWGRHWEQTQAAPGEFELSREQDELTHARVLAAESRYSEILPSLERLAQATQAGGRWGRFLEIRILQAIVLQGCGEKIQALQRLEEALTLAEPEGYLRVFVDRGETMQSLLAVYVGSPAAPHRAYALRLIAAFPVDPCPETHEAQAWLEPLTPRELEILGLVAAGLTNRQIAAQLILAEGTVKFYVHSVLEKLGVHHRTQAILEAKKRKII